MDIILEPWPWYVAGPLIAFVMMLLLYFGNQFGFSSNFRTACTILGAGKYSDFFKIDWKAQTWNLVFLVGAVIGGFIAHQYLTTSEQIALSQNTIQKLENLGFANPGESYLPAKLFGAEAIGSLGGILILLVGGILVGFGTRYAGGCTSGHAISGLSNLQLPSLIAVIGFFIGGLIIVHFIMPIIYT